MKERRSSPETGASAVEFALVVPIFLLLVFGIMYFGLIFAQDLSLGNAARQGARTAVVGDASCGAIKSEVQDASATIGLQNTSAVNVTIKKRTSAGLVDPCSGPGDIPCKGSSAGDTIYVKALYSSTMTFPFAPPKINAGGEGEFRCEFS